MEASVTHAPSRLSEDRAATARRQLARTTERRVNIAMVAAHTVGAVDLFALLFWVLPEPKGAGMVLRDNLVAGGVYLVLATALGMFLGRRISPTRADWAREDRDPTPQERADVLRAPMRCLRMDAALWFGGLVLLTLVNLPTSVDLAFHVAATVFLGGLTTCAVAYLMVERLMRPVTALVLADGDTTPRTIWPGVEGRLVLAWIAATGSPLLGLIMLGFHGLVDDSTSREELARSVLALGGVAIGVGLAVAVVVARSLAGPLTALRRATARVEAGDLSASVRVDDASEVGLLQSGFNRMLDGLRERERVEDLYSRQVGQEVAAASLGADLRLGGEVCETAVLFVDMIGSTAHAIDAPPHQVVDRLNRFFAIVVDVVAVHGGWVNKFEGDAALCVFGAPVPHADPAGSALAMARDLHRRLREEMPSADAGIGLSAGPVVAGWVGAEQRFEYTVIGDPVNEAARLCELAKDQPGRVLASEAVVVRAGAAEAGRWRTGDTALLRGRPMPTRLAVPA